MAASLCKVRFSSVPIKAKKTGSVLLLSAHRIKWSQQVHLCGHSKGSPGLQARVRAIPLLIATGGGYFGYNRYERYKDRELEKLGITVPPRVATSVQELNTTGGGPSAQTANHSHTSCPVTSSEGWALSSRKAPAEAKRAEGPTKHRAVYICLL
ncbi:phosphatidylserine decarboxylase proenzyme, mitochondrial isoform X2 [Tachysurus ichikawai]